jgi:hypothetical protein
MFVFLMLVLGLFCPLAWGACRRQTKGPALGNMEPIDSQEDEAVEANVKTTRVARALTSYDFYFVGGG